MRRKLMIGAISVVLLSILWLAWVRFVAPTKIALVNFPNYQVARMAKSIDNRFIKLEQVGLDQFDRLDRYDAVMVFAMGIRMTDEHRQLLNGLKERKMPIISTAVTDPMNNICSLDSLKEKMVADYLSYGGRSNYRNLFNYIRCEITGKSLLTGAIDKPLKIGSDLLFHLEEERLFEHVADYESYYRDGGFYKENGPKVALVVGMAGPFDSNKDHLDSLIVSLERRGINVYPITGVTRRLDFLKEIEPDAVIYMPHGRLMMGHGDRAVEWLKSKNIPLFCPITINDTYDNWMADKRGMVGGFMSQSIVMPELDGGIVPYTLNAQFVDEDGLYLFKPIPGRLEPFTEMVENYLQLQTKPNSEKRIAIYYYKGPGKNAMMAAGLEVAPSLYNLLKHLKEEGYNVTNLPDNEKLFERMIAEQGAIFNSYAEGNIDRYLNSGYPAWVSDQTYNGWLERSFSAAMRDTLKARHGAGVGEFYTQKRDGEESIAVTRIELGNIVLLPQPTQGVGENSFAAVHGSNPVPPHHYIASYLWAQYGFEADAMIHFGTHGSLEFIPGKQVALSSDDWADRLVGSLPHFYIYTIADVGEGLIAKRRSYATTVSHLTPPFIETGLRREVDGLLTKIKRYLATDNRDMSLNRSIKEQTIKMGLHRDLQLDSIATDPYSDEEVEKIENFAEELCEEKILAGQYVMGVPYEESEIRSSVSLMCVEPIAYSLSNLDMVRGKVTPKEIEQQALFNERYRIKARKAVDNILDNPSEANSPALLAQLGITEELLSRAAMIKRASVPKRRGMMADATSGATVKDSFSKDDIKLANAVLEIKRSLENVESYRKMLRDAPEQEMQAMVNALNGRYLAPSPGGDIISDPNVLPTGRNLYGINAESTPTPAAWDKGVELARSLLAQHAKAHGGATPKKVSFTLWSGSFVESEGATLAQILYMLGVEPIRDQFNRVLDIRLIDEKELGRPRVDVVVQTSGQFRDIAASRLSLIQRAVDLASSANDRGENYVSQGRDAAERLLLDKGYSPKDARAFATQRVFGGANGMSGTGITAMVESGDRWESEGEIAQVYLNNMGATYGDEQAFGSFKPGVFEAALQNTEAVVQPRQSNTWGALSLDHVYEFMGGINLTVRNVTGREPDAYFNDLRNRHNARLQDLKTAIGVESRSTLFNPVYMREQMKEGASAANVMSETVRNTYGWNVMKPDAIDQSIWNRYYDVFVNDQLNVGVREFFERENPAALQEATAVMLETARKGYWKASPGQLKRLAELHTELVDRYEAGCSGFVCDNAKLQGFISKQVESSRAEAYQQKINSARDKTVDGDAKGVVLKKEREASMANSGEVERFSSFNLALAIFSTLFVILFIIYIIKRRSSANSRK